MKNMKFYFSILMTILIILLAGIAIPARADDHTRLTFGLTPLELPGFEFEQKLSDQFTFCLDGGISLGILGGGYGINYYFNKNSLDGFYAGLDQVFYRDDHVIDKIFSDIFSLMLNQPPGPPIAATYSNLTTVVLGYKEVRDSGVIVNFLIFYGDNAWGASLGIMKGFRW